MKNISQTFDFARFVNVIKRDLTLSGNALLLRFIVMTGVICLFMCLVAAPMTMDHENYHYYVVSQASTTFVVFQFTMFLFCLIGASTFMENLNSMPKCINSLMIPASNVEKYLSRIVICIVGVFIAFLIAFSLAEIARYIFIKLYFPQIPVKPFACFSQSNISISLINTASSFISAQATYVLGSVIWPKKSFVKTTIACLIFWVLFAFAMFNINRFLPNFFLINGIPSKNLEVPSIVVQFAWTAICYGLSYYLFRKKEIIDRIRI